MDIKSKITEFKEEHPTATKIVKVATIAGAAVCGGREPVRIKAGRDV